MANEDIKRYAKSKNVKLFQIGKVLGMNDGNFSRKLRYEFSDDEKKNVYGIIDDLSNVDFSKIPTDTAIIRYTSMMNSEQKQYLLACAEQILLKESEE